MEEVRAPIEYKTERLVEPEVKPNVRKTRKGKKTTHDSMIVMEEQIIDDILSRDIEQMMIQSQIEYVEQMQKEHEKELLIRERRKENVLKFTNVRNQLKRIGKMDKDIKKLEDILEPIIDSYCDDDSRRFDFDKETNEFIIKHLKSIRLKPGEFELIQSLFK